MWINCEVYIQLIFYLNSIYYSDFSDNLKRKYKKNTNKSFLIFLKIDNKEFLFNFNQSVYSNYLSGDIVHKGEKTELKFMENNNLFSEEEWSELYKLSEDTFVEETDELKQSAAGAGLTDND